MKQLIETIKQLLVFLLLHKTLFLKGFELNQLWIQTKSDLTNSNYPKTHPTKLKIAFKQSMEIWNHQCSFSTLCNRWMERSDGFVVRSTLFLFTVLDVCLGIGLRVVGEKLNLAKIEKNCKSMSFFQTTDVSVKMIYDEIVKHRNQCSIEDFCRLYILLVMS